MFNIDGSDEQMLAGRVVNPYGLCVDDFHEHLYYIVGGLGGQIRCRVRLYAMQKDVLLDVVDYAYNCAVDNSWPRTVVRRTLRSLLPTTCTLSPMRGSYQQLDRVNKSNPRGAHGGRLGVGK